MRTAPHVHGSNRGLLKDDCRDTRGESRVVSLPDPHACDIRDEVT